MLTPRLADPIKAAVSVAERVSRIAVLALAMLIPHVMSAQGLISVGAGVGSGINDRSKRSDSGGGAHVGGYVQLHVPVIPVALRGDVLFTNTSNAGTVLMADAVYLAPIPVVSPYVMAGMGKYGIGKDVQGTGWNAGIGVRVRTPVVAFYVEGKRHERIGQDLLTIGVSR